MAESNAQIGTPKAWEAGRTGKGAKVAVLDTGVHAGHSDLTGRLAETKNFIEGGSVKQEIIRATGVKYPCSRASWPGKARLSAVPGRALSRGHQPAMKGDQGTVKRAGRCRSGTYRAGGSARL